MTADTSGGLPVQAGTALGSLTTSYDMHWIFLGTNGHVYQIIYNPGATQLGQIDMTNLANAPPPPSPNITSLSLSQGPAQMGFQIVGTGLGASPPSGGSVTLGGTNLTVISWGLIPGTAQTAITVQIPANIPLTPSANAYEVVVNVSANQASNGLPFTLTTSFGCP